MQADCSVEPHQFHAGCHAKLFYSVTRKPLVNKRVSVIMSASLHPKVKNNAGKPDNNSSGIPSCPISSFPALPSAHNTRPGSLVRVSPSPTQINSISTPCTRPMAIPGCGTSVNFHPMSTRCCAWATILYSRGWPAILAVSRKTSRPAVSSYSKQPHLRGWTSPPAFMKYSLYLTPTHERPR